MRKKDKPILSFCIPTYNRAHVVTRAVKSILKYQGDDIEVVVSDNCSTDNTLEELNKINDKRLKVYSNGKNFGFNYNFLKVLEKSSGEYCFMLSDEDIVLTDKIFHLINLLKNNNYGLIISSLKKDDLHNQASTTKKDFNLKTYIKDILRPIYHLVKYGEIRYKKGYYNYYSQNIYSKIETIKLIFSRTYLTGLVIKKELIDVDKLLSKETDIYPQVRLMLLINERSRTFFTKEPYAIYTDSSLFSYIFHEKGVNSPTYAHPSLRYYQMNYFFDWLEDLNLDYKEKRMLYSFLFERFINASLGGYKRFVSQSEKKLSEKELKRESRFFLKMSKKMEKEVKDNEKYREELIKLGEDFLDHIIYK